jgi:hypothetical protein
MILLACRRWSDLPRRTARGAFLNLHDRIALRFFSGLQSRRIRDRLVHHDRIGSQSTLHLCPDFLGKIVYHLIPHPEQLAPEQDDQQNQGNQDPYGAPAFRPIRHFIRPFSRFGATGEVDL